MPLERIHNSMVDVQVDNFNANQKDLAETTLTAANADIYTTPASTRTLVYSIRVSNTDSVARTVTMTLSDNSAGPAEFKLAHQVSINGNEYVEILSRPIVLETSDKIRGLASLAGVLDVTIVGIELIADTDHFNAARSLPDTALNTIFTGTSSGQVIESIYLVADGAGATTATVTWTTNSGGTLIDWTKDLAISANSVVEILERPKSVRSGDIIQVQAGNASYLDVVISGRNK